VERTNVLPSGLLVRRLDNKRRIEYCSSSGSSIAIVVGRRLTSAAMRMSAEDRLEPDVTAGPERGGFGPTESMTPGDTAGTVIGPYHLLQKIGEGGMGRSGSPSRRVALKLIKAGMNTAK
jgi:hypothetical protein